MASLPDLIDTLRRDGFVVVKDFLPVDQVVGAHQELEAWFEKDKEARKAAGLPEHKFAWEGPAGRSQLTPPSHLLLDVYAKSPAFDGLFEKILTDPLSRGLLTALAGPRFKMRGYNIRRMTGAYNPAPAHEWHRDSPGEFGIGIFLTDVLPGEHAATALVPGSHLFPFDPRWNTLFPGPYPGLQWFKGHNQMSRKLAQVALKDAAGAYGKRGDFYLFINDVWHGREPNLRGSQTMVSLCGAFPTEFPYPDKVPVPPPEVLERLSPVIREVVRQDQPPNDGRDSLLHWTLANRQKITLGDPFFAARLERKTADLVSAICMPGVWMGEHGRRGVRYFIFRATRTGFVRAMASPALAAYYVRKYFKLGVYYGRLYPRLGVRWVYRRTLKRWRQPGVSS